MNSKRLTLLLSVSVTALALGGCATESYCFSGCGDEDAGATEASTGGSGGANTGGNAGDDGGMIITGGSGGNTGGTAGTSGCTETNGGKEICDGKDNDCNGKTDELFDLTKDPRHCGTCETDCTLVIHSAKQATCTATVGTPGTCGYTECSDDYWDLDGDKTNGCEYYCVKKADDDKTCDNIDDNCDGKLDDGIDFCTDASNCGKCGRNCQGKAHAVGQCVPTDPNATSCDDSNTQCKIKNCEPGFIDANGIFQDGCEYTCTPTKRTDPNDPKTLVECDPKTDSECGKREYCDGKDNDCDGKIDAFDSDLTNATSGDPALLKACFGSNNGECATASHQGITQCLNAQVKCVNDNTGSTTCTKDSECTDPNKPFCVDAPSGTGKVCGTKVLRVNDTPEICDKKDNDCDGTVDDSPSDTGAYCGSNIGSCVQGKTICDNGGVKCSGAVGPQPDVCNGADDDCDGVIDGTAAKPEKTCTKDSDCAAVTGAHYCLPKSTGGTNVCAALAADIVTANGTPKACDTPPAPPSGWTTPCKAGTFTCTGGVARCEGAVKPQTGQDECGKDMNCNGLKDPDFNTQTDPHNCGSCGNDCATKHPGSHVHWMCDKGTCKPDTTQPCDPGHINCNNDPSSCETACVFHSDKEICNGEDDDCDCKVDEAKSATEPNGVDAPSPSQVCGVSSIATDPGCTSGVTVACNAGSWKCTFPSGYCDQGSPASCASTPDICDSKDNNCNGTVDENFKQPILTDHYLGQVCHSDDGISPKHGVCQQTGSYQCKDTKSTACMKGSTVIAGVADSSKAGPELCDGVDNDCDGTIDDSWRNKGSNSTYWVKPAVTKIHVHGDDVWMFSYEASRPSASQTTAGTGNGWWRSSNMLPLQPTPPANTALGKTPACSQQGKIPWFNISGLEAQHVCVEMGGRLCTDQEWTYSCKGASHSCDWGFRNSCTNYTANCSGNTCNCNLGPYDFDTSTSGNQDGLLPTAWNSSPPAAIANTCRSSFGTAGNFYDITGNLRELACPDSTLCSNHQSDFVLMGGAFNTSDPSGEGAKCDFTFYNVDDTFKLYDVGFRCCFDSDPTK